MAWALAAALGVVGGACSSDGAGPAMRGEANWPADGAGAAPEQAPGAEQDPGGGSVTGIGGPPAIAPVMISQRAASKSGVCDDLSVSANPIKPQMLIMLDRSQSMVDQARWEPSVQAIRAVVDRLQDRIDFGLGLYPEVGSGQFGGNPCTSGGVTVTAAPMNAAAIGAALNTATPSGGWTPTAASLMRILTEFVDVPINPDEQPADKYILLVTDGQPNCGDNNLDSRPADVEQSNQAVEALTAAGAKTYVIGYRGADPNSMPDAGMMMMPAPGLFGPPPAPPAWETLAPVLDGFAMRGGTGDTMHRPVDDQDTLVAELERISQVVIPCNYQLMERIPDPMYVRVVLDGVQLMLNDPNGFVMVDTQGVELTGTSCDALKDGMSHQLSVEVTCEPVF